jgi:small subunit ribosomal protein S8
VSSTKEKFGKRNKKANIENMNKTNYPTGDFLIRIKNAGMAGRKTVECASSGLIAATAKVLQEAGFLEEVNVKDGQIAVKLRYHKKAPLLTNITLVSKPGLRVYKRYEDLEKIKGPSIFIVSTPKGVMSSIEAIKNKLGGEVIAKVL